MDSKYELHKKDLESQKIDLESHKLELAARLGNLEKSQLEMFEGKL